MKDSVKVELSKDGLSIRPKDKPASWPMAAVIDPLESTLKVDVAEFIPRKENFKVKSLCIELEPPSAEILSSSAPPELEGMWTEVKRRHRISDITSKKISFSREIDDDDFKGTSDKDELDFMFDEELPDISSCGRNNNFSNEWLVLIVFN